MSIFISQRTGRQIIKRLNISSGAYRYDAKFGIWAKKQTLTNGFQYPYGITTDGVNIFVCDGQNKRIFKLDLNLQYIAHCDVSNIGEPYVLHYDLANTEKLYVIGIKDQRFLTMASILIESFTIEKETANLAGASLNNQIPLNITRGYAIDDFLIAGFGQLYKVIEDSYSFTFGGIVPINDSVTDVRGIVKHTDGFLYLISQSQNKAKLIKVNSLYKNVGDSNIISKQCTYLTQGSGSSVLIYDNANLRILRFDTNLNLIEIIYKDAGNTITTDAEDISGICENFFIPSEEGFIIQDLIIDSETAWQITSNPLDQQIQNVEYF
jgi:hypothetical protein